MHTDPFPPAKNVVESARPGVKQRPDTTTHNPLPPIVAVRMILNKYWNEFERGVKPTLVAVKVAAGSNAKVAVSGGTC